MNKQFKIGDRVMVTEQEIGNDTRNWLIELKMSPLSVGVVETLSPGLPYPLDTLPAFKTIGVRFSFVDEHYPAKSAFGLFSANALTLVDDIVTTSKSKHPHAKYIRGWLDGKTVQCEVKKGEWINYLSCGSEPTMPEFGVLNNHRFMPISRYTWLVVQDVGAILTPTVYTEAEVKRIWPDAFRYEKIPETEINTEQ